MLPLPYLVQVGTGWVICVVLLVVSVWVVVVQVSGVSV